MTMFVSAKDFAVIQLVAISLYRFEPTAILGKCAQRSLASRSVVRMTLRLDARNEIEHLPGLRLGKGAHLVVDVFGRAHQKSLPLSGPRAKLKVPGSKSPVEMTSCCATFIGLCRI